MAVRSALPRARALLLALLATGLAVPAAGPGPAHAAPLPPAAVAPPDAPPAPAAARRDEVLVILDVVVAQGPLPPVWEPARPAPPGAMRDGRGGRGEGRSAVAEEGLMPFPEVVACAQRRVGGALIGADYDPRRAVYRLTFLNQGVVIRVLSDARTCQILAVQSR